MLHDDPFPKDLSLVHAVNNVSVEAPMGLRTSYILKSPELTLDQCCTPVAILYSCDECSWKGPCFTLWIRLIKRKYRFVGGRGWRKIAFTGISS